MNALLTSAQTRLGEALSGQLSDPVGAAAMVMYDALMASLTAAERSTFVDQRAMHVSHQIRVSRGGNLSEVLRQFENHCAQSNLLRLGVKHL
jgi:hypothetical protein